MSPYVTKIEEKEIIDTDTINKESILFLSHDRIQYTQSIVFLPKDNVQQLKEKYSLLEKRGLDIKYNYF
jgi:MoaA/NifB/PqqE/SkfB family radical SAM enzyme